MVKSVANYVIVYPPFPFPKLRVPKTEKKLKGIAEDISANERELLFEVVVERFLVGYTERINAVLENEELSVDECLEAFLKEMDQSASIYYDVLQGDKLHWTIQHALHNKTIETIVPFIQKKIDGFISKGKLISRLDVDSGTLAAVFIKGVEAIIHSGKEVDHAEYHSERIKKGVFDFFNLLFDVPC